MIHKTTIQYSRFKDNCFNRLFLFECNCNPLQAKKKKKILCSFAFPNFDSDIEI